MSKLDDLADARREAAVAAPGAFTLGDRTYILPPATPEDFDEWLIACRDLVRADMADPLDVLNAKLNEMQTRAAGDPTAEPVNPVLVRELAALALAGKTADRGRGKVEPTVEQAAAKTLSLEGVRWWVFYRLKKAGAAVTPAEVAGLVTEDTWRPTSSALARIDKIGKLVPKPTTPTG